MRLPEVNFVDDKGGKPVGINQHIGRRPIAAFGNSDGDREMLEYAQGWKWRALRGCLCCTMMRRVSLPMARPWVCPRCETRRLHAGAL